METTNTEAQQNTAQEYEDADPSQFNKRMKYIYWIVAAALIITIGMFWYHISYKNNEAGFSKTSQDWATFGGYVGGVLSPFFSLLAFVALLWTINIQMRQLAISNKALLISKTELQLSRKELELTREELTKTAEAAQQQVKHFQDESMRSDVYRIIEKLVGRIDYNYKVVPLILELNLIDLALNRTRLNSDSLRGYIGTLQTHYENKSSLTFNTIQSIEHDLELLLRYLKMYETPIGKQHLLDFYRAEYVDLMTFLCEKGFLLNEDLFKDFLFS